MTATQRATLLETLRDEVQTAYDLCVETLRQCGGDTNDNAYRYVWRDYVQAKTEYNLVNR